MNIKEEIKKTTNQNRLLIEKKYNYLNLSFDDVIMIIEDNISNIKSYNNLSGLSRYVHYMFEIDSIIIKDIANKFKKDENNNIDGVINIIKKYIYLSYYIAKRKQIDLERSDIKRIGEDSIINALENYDGKKLFTIHTANIIQDNLKEFQKIKK